MTLPLRILLLVLFFTPLDQADAGALTRGPYLVAAATSAVRVCWRWSGEDEDECRIHEGLPAGSTFSYSIPGSAKRWTGSTLPSPEQPVHFAVFGDSGQQTRVQFRVAKRLRALDPDLVLLLGDIIYPSGQDKHYPPRYFKPYAQSLPRFPFFPSLGNHDYGNAKRSKKKGERRFREVYQRIHRRPKYYSFDAGPAHFISLDTNEAYSIPAAAPIRRRSPQWKWLKDDLTRNKAAWTFVFMHVPLYVSRDHGDHAFLRDAIEELLIEYGVDMVFAGHRHYYERTKPIDDVIHITAGTGGAGIASWATPKEFSETIIRSNGLVSVKTTMNEVLLRFIDDEGQVRDTLTLKK